MPNLGPIEVVVMLFFWLLPAILVAKYASRKGHSFAVFLILGLAVSWVVSLLVAVFVVEPGGNDNSDLDRISKLAELNQRGAITDEEFATQKAQLLGQPPASRSTTYADR